MDNPISLLCLVGVGLLIFWVVSRMMAGRNARPSVDDPNLRSTGGIGGGPSGPGQRTADDPNLRSTGSIGSGPSGPSQSTADDPDLRSRGAIGGPASPPRSQGRPGIGAVFPSGAHNRDDDDSQAKHLEPKAKSGSRERPQRPAATERDNDFPGSQLRRSGGDGPEVGPRNNPTGGRTSIGSRSDSPEGSDRDSRNTSGGRTSIGSRNTAPSDPTPPRRAPRDDDNDGDDPNLRSRGSIGD